MGLLPRDRRASFAVLAGGLLTITCVGLSAWAIGAHHGADLATEDLEAARAEAAPSRGGAAGGFERGGGTGPTALADSRRLAALSETQRAERPDRSLLLAVEAIHCGDTLEVRGSLFDAALLTRPSVTAFYHGAGGLVWSVAFSPDGQTLAVEYSDDHGRGVVLWDVPLRRRLGKRPLDVAEGDVTSLAFSPDGKTLAVGFRNIDARQAGRISRGGVVLFDIDPESWKERAGRIANRNLTREEWREYLPDTPYRATFAHLPPPPDDESGPPSSPATGAKGASADQPTLRRLPREPAAKK